MSRTKALFVLIDAAEKDLILDWSERGLLPAFGRLRRDSAWGVTRAPLGMHPGAAWPSFYTGASPARHGRYSHRQIRCGTYETFRTGAQETCGEPFWNALGRAGRRVAVIDVPEASLVKDLDGIQVVDWLPHCVEEGFRTTPRELAQEIAARYGDERIGLCDHVRLGGADDYRRFRDALVDRARRKAALSVDLLGRDEWDLFLTTFTESHCVGHRCWHLHDSGHPDHDPALEAKLGDPLRDVYRAIDEGLSRLLGFAGPETTVIVLSNIGMGPNYNGDHLLAEVLHRLGHTPPPRSAGALWRLLRWGWRRLPVAPRRRVLALQEDVVDRTWPALDARASCFAVWNGEVYGAIRVNLAGREPRGRIASGADYEAFCGRLAQDLLALQRADGSLAVRRVLRTADLYDGPRADVLPDLLVEWSTDAPIDAVRSDETGVVRMPYRGPRTGHHRREGLFFARGPGISPGRLDEPVSLTDFAPTVAALLGVAPEEMDGEVIGEIAGERSPA